MQLSPEDFQSGLPSFSYKQDVVGKKVYKLWSGVSKNFLRIS